jgi:hypothetical protein
MYLTLINPDKFFIVSNRQKLGYTAYMTVCGIQENTVSSYLYQYSFHGCWMKVDDILVNKRQ